MKVQVISCGPFANDSERKAIEQLKTSLISELGDGEWLLLTNLAFSATHRRQFDEIDVVAIGPPGVRIIEVKHWPAAWVNRNAERVEHEADRVTDKARRVGTTLRRKIAAIGRVDGVFLVTEDASKVRPLEGREVRGVQFHTLKACPRALGLEGRASLSPQQIRMVAKALYPKTEVIVDGALRRLAGYVNLELQTASDERFHRIYRGTHSTRRNRVLLHLYDLSATDRPNPEAKARREFDALHRLQFHIWAPRIDDSFQEAPGYAGEMWFFTVGDPAAPCIGERAADDTWDTKARLAFARHAADALAGLHQAGENGEPMLHRNLTLDTVLVRHDNTPILTGLHHARIPADVMVADSSATWNEGNSAVAPEVRTLGLGGADTRSDIYSLCASLSVLFAERDDEGSRKARDVLTEGLEDDPGSRSSLQALHDSLSEMLGESPEPSPPPARFWTEDQIVRFRGRDYRIVSPLGSGGVGATFKVVRIDPSTGGDLGAYVAKVVRDEETGRKVLGAYNLVHSHLHQSTALSTIFETADRWRDNDFIALMAWIEGEPLSELSGVLPLLAEDFREESEEALVLRWLRTTCDALDVLHCNGLVHGDVSPRNLIVSDSELVLTDYDCVTKVGQPRGAPGTIMYSSHTHLEDRLTEPSDDVFALAASFFHVLFDKEPFSYDGRLTKERGLNWGDVEREEYPTVAVFLDKATDPDPARRFASATEAKAFLSPPVPIDAANADEPAGTGAADSAALPSEFPTRSENEVLWLRSLLQSYPGSRWGNRETRGLDTDFAVDTYVETKLEQLLFEQISERRVRLVVLCGNAGDGKTALLQHLAGRLGFGDTTSETRILKKQLDDGLTVRMNFDGSASWRGRSADELLNEFLAPFQHGEPAEDLVHLLAINDGRLLEWIELTEERTDGGTPLTGDLAKLLDADDRAPPPTHIRFISLNQRSLVGGVTADKKDIETGFLDALVDRLYGGERAAEFWTPCQTCSAEGRCEVRRAMRLFGPEWLPNVSPEKERTRARQRLFEAFQAVYLRGETHITVRELRASLVYILFGTHYCSDFHNPSHSAGDPQPYWDRAFAPDSPAKQGEVLRELIRFDPALEAHPKIDRYLSRSGEWTDESGTRRSTGEGALGSARRRAYFELSGEELETISGSRDALGLARGCFTRDFRDLPIREDARDNQCRRLCRGISRLEDLPPQALDREDVVPLRITPRTPTETAFWVEKKVDDFRLEVELPREIEGFDRLQREATLIYRYRDGEEERLRLGADLFHVLRELDEGYQLGDVSTDDTFAQLSIFVQRLVREDERRVLVWNPMKDDVIYDVAARIIEPETPDALQQMHLRHLEDSNG